NHRKFADRRSAAREVKPSRPVTSRHAARSGSAKLHAQTRVRAPDHMASLTDFVVADDQHEIVRNAHLTCHLEARAGRGHIAHAASDAAGTVERDRARFQGAEAL